MSITGVTAVLIKKIHSSHWYGAFQPKQIRHLKISRFLFYSLAQIIYVLVLSELKIYLSRYLCPNFLNGVEDRLPRGPTHQVNL